MHAPGCQDDVPAPMAPVQSLFSRTGVSDYYDVDPLDDATALDPATDFQEASKLTPGLARVSTGPALQFWAPEHVPLRDEGLATRRLLSRSVALPRPEPVDMSLSAAVAARQSSAPPGAASVSATELSTLLAIAYGATPAPGDPRGHRRPVPSGGAMYPLDVYVGIGPGGSVASGLYHYDPFRHVLEQITGRPGWDALVGHGASPDVQGESSLALLLVACFWRQSSKYGLRGHRFAYLEAGHVGQNIVLCAAAHGLRALPYGAFYDARVEAELGLDGVHESLVHAVLVGRR